MSTAEDKMGRAMLVFIVGIVVVVASIVVGFGWAALKIVGLL
jgi:hypothetical protein